MVLRPQISDLKIIGYYLGKIIVGLGLVNFIPMLWGLVTGEIVPAADFLIAALICFIIGFLLDWFCYTELDPGWMHGMVITALTWLVAMFFGAIPLYFSGHYFSFLDACFETMSGYATTGLTLTQDLDHMSFAHNLWRHLIMFIGGQGVVIAALSLFTASSAGAFRMYVGEAREEKILPNVISTARFIWLVSFVFLFLGTLALGVCGTLNGMSVKTAFFHGACVFMAAFDTGGFTPQSQNILYYHSLSFEVITIVIMLLGSINFKVHYLVWNGNRKELWKNIETVTLFFTLIITFLITAAGLRQTQAYPEIMSMFRKGFYQLVSGHTGTGYMTIYARQFINEWGPLALIGITLAMAFGGSSCSTTGGIKTIRIGLVLKGFIQDIKRILLSEETVVIKKFHHIKDIILDDKLVRSAALITLAYLVLYGLGALVGVMLGYPFLESLFESTSAAANVGLSCGITQASMPAVLKVTYIIQMWAGRLEFVAIFTLVGFLVAFIKGK